MFRDNKLSLPTYRGLLLYVMTLSTSPAEGLASVLLFREHHVSECSDNIIHLSLLVAGTVAQLLALGGG